MVGPGVVTRLVLINGLHEGFFFISPPPKFLDKGFLKLIEQKLSWCIRKGLKFGLIVMMTARCVLWAMYELAIQNGRHRIS
jgi:hypothetical protein